MSKSDPIEPIMISETKGKEYYNCDRLWGSMDTITCLDILIHPPHPAEAIGRNACQLVGQ